MFPLKFTSVPNNPELEGFAAWVRDVPFFTATGTKLLMQLLVPWAANEPENAEKRWPCIVFVQGSAWTFPALAEKNHQLCW